MELIFCLGFTKSLSQSSPRTQRRREKPQLLCFSLTLMATVLLSLIDTAQPEAPGVTSALQHRSTCCSACLCFPDQNCFLEKWRQIKKKTEAEKKCGLFLWGKFRSRLKPAKVTDELCQEFICFPPKLKRREKTSPFLFLSHSFFLDVHKPSIHGVWPVIKGMFQFLQETLFDLWLCKITVLYKAASAVAVFERNVMSHLWL